MATAAFRVAHAFRLFNVTLGTCVADEEKKFVDDQ